MRNDPTDPSSPDFDPVYYDYVRNAEKEDIAPMSFRDFEDMINEEDED
jgi:hypothetical protein